MRPTHLCEYVLDTMALDLFAKELVIRQV